MTVWTVVSIVAVLLIGATPALGLVLYARHLKREGDEHFQDLAHEFLLEMEVEMEAKRMLAVREKAKA